MAEIRSIGFEGKPVGSLALGSYAARAAAAGWRLLRRVWDVPLEWRFLLFSVVVLVAGAFVIGSWTAGEIRARVLQRSAATNALYVDSFISPLLQSLEDGGDLTASQRNRLHQLLRGTPLGEKVVSFKVWTLSGSVVHATDARLEGKSFPIKGHLQTAIDGGVRAFVTDLEAEENEFERLQWGTLVETYAPVRSHRTGQVIAVSEFYQRPDDIFGEIQSSQQKGWLIVGSATFVMFLVLNGMVRQASLTIRRQHDGLRQLTSRLRTASASRAQTEEQVMSRIAQDLHDAPAQNLAVALLRLDDLAASSHSTSSQDWALVKTSLASALADLRGISSGLRIPELSDLDADELIYRAVDDVQARTGCAVSTEARAAHARLSGAAKVAVFRIIQEALNNSYLHSGARERSVVATVRDGYLEVEVADDGCGFDEAARGRPDSGRSRLGVRGMRDRIEVLGGTLIIRSRPGEGTRVIARVPLDSRDST